MNDRPEEDPTERLDSAGDERSTESLVPDREEDPTGRLAPDSGEEPTGHLTPDEGDDPTERLDSSREDDPTERLTSDPAQVDPTGVLPERGAGDRTDPLPRGRSDGRRLGFTVLVGSILAAIALCGTYIAAGGLAYAPSGGSDPCAPSPWGSPQGLEATAERFSLAAIDGAACELGVSREELTRVLADEGSRERFAADHNLSQSEIEDAVRAGLLRATDDAERGGALSSLAATGARLAIKVMPMSVMVALIDNASTLFQGGGGALDDLGGALDLLGGGSDSDPGGSGSGGGLNVNPGDIPGRVGGALTDKLKEQLPPEVQQVLPEDLGSQVEKGLNDLIKP